MKLVELPEDTPACADANFVSTVSALSRSWLILIVWHRLMLRRSEILRSQAAYAGSIPVIRNGCRPMVGQPPPRLWP